MSLELQLLEAIETENYETMEALIDQGANVDYKNDNGSSLLHLAADKGDRRLAQLLLDNFADVNVRNKQGFTALHVAAIKKDTQMVDLLAEYQSPLEWTFQTTEKVDFSALMWAIAEGDDEIAKVLLHHSRFKANLDAKVPFSDKFKYDRMSLLCFALLHNNMTVVEGLLDCGVEVKGALDEEAVEQPLLNPFYVSLMEEKTGETLAQFVDLLKKYEKSFNMQDALSIAIQFGNASSVEKLVERGADLNAENSMEKLPSFYINRNTPEGKEKTEIFRKAGLGEQVEEVDNVFRMKDIIEAEQQALDDVAKEQVQLRKRFTADLKV